MPLNPYIGLKAPLKLGTFDQNSYSIKLIFILLISFIDPVYENDIQKNDKRMIKDLVTGVVKDNNKGYLTKKNRNETLPN